jgi:ribonuclease HI
MMTGRKLSVFTDGGARGNPGPAAVGFVVKDSQDKTLVEAGKYIGQATNNVAEYRAVIEALLWIKEHLSFRPAQIIFSLDSKLAVNQLNGLFKVKNHGLRNLIVKVRQLERGVGGNVAYRFIPREKNKKADTLVNQSLDSRIF